MKAKTLGTIIAELRREQGMTQLELADRMGVTDKAVSKWERDLFCPDINSFPHLAEVLHVSVNELMQIKTSPSPSQRSVHEIANVIFRAVALAMGIAVVVLSILGALDAQTGVTLLGLGLASLALYSLQEKE